MLKAGIDISSVVYGRGVSRYTTNLVRSLLLKPEMQLSLYGTSLRQNKELTKIAQDLKKETGRKAHTVIRPHPPSLYTFLWNQLRYPGIRSVLKDIDIFHSWDWIQPPDKDLPLISTIHDLAILRYPETAHPKIVSMHQKSWQVLKDRKAHIIAVSRATKNDIVELLDIPQERIHVIHEALPQEVPQTMNSMTEVRFEEIKLSLKLDKPFIFFVGTREPRKNLTRLIEAWQALANSEIELIIAGEAWEKGEEEKAVSGLRYLGRVSDEQLSVLYSEAAVFAYPSLYEGFGLPILEAFHHGTPVVTSNNSALPEIAGNAAELVDAESVDSIRFGLQTVLQESKTDQQKRLQRMIIRSQMFSWKRVAEQTMNAYTETIASMA